jgi:hypothetical protein
MLNGPVSIDTVAFAGPRTTSSSPRYLRVNVSPPPTGTFNLQHGVRDSIYQPGLQDWNLALINHRCCERADQFPMPRASFTISQIIRTRAPPTSRGAQSGNLQLSLRFAL